MSFFYPCPFCKQPLLFLGAIQIYDHKCYLDNLFSQTKKNEMEIDEEMKIEEKKLFKEENQEKEKLHIIKINTPENENFLKCPMLYCYEPVHMDLISKCFGSCPPELPKFYSISKRILSLNSLQQNRYFEEEFLYYHTKYRCEMGNQIDECINSNLRSKFHLKGLMATGKSYFLSDYVLRKRVKGKNAKFRILYINNSVEFIRCPLSYLFNEIIFMLNSDFNEIIDEVSLKIWFEKLNEDQSSKAWGKYMDFLFCLKKYFNYKGIKMILIWDQINVLYRTSKMIKDEIKIYKDLTNSHTFFDHIILSASSNNEEINIKNEKVSIIEMNPFEVFNKTEFLNLIQEEISLWNLVPNDIKKENISEYTKYISELSDILNFSISEYHSYKSIAWDHDLYCFTTKEKNFQSNRDKYFEKRKIEIEKSEEKFRTEYLKNTNDLNEYSSIIKKIRVFNEKLHYFEGKTDSYYFTEKPTLYNKQFLFYIQKEKILVCTSSLIRYSIGNLIFNSAFENLNPWKRLDNSINADLFQLHVQSYYLNKQQILSFGNKIQIRINKKHYFYDCLTTLQELRLCKDLGLSILCHFLQSNHFVDSMVYDGEIQTLIMIQITVDKNHGIHYDKIEKLIKNQDFQLRIGEKKDYFKKYKLFFKELTKQNLVKKYVFQWMTNKIYDELIINSDKEKKRLIEPNSLEIIPFDISLINEINDGLH